MSAFNGLQLLNYIEITKDGYFDRETLQGAVTKFIARPFIPSQKITMDEQTKYFGKLLRHTKTK